MKQRILIISITAFCVIATVALVVFLIHSPHKGSDTSYQLTVDNALTIYADAISQIDPSKSIGYSVHLTKEMTIGTDVFVETSHRNIYCDIQQSGASHISVQETLYTGTHTINITELFVDNTVYQTINDVPFSSKCNLDQFWRSQVPMVILTADIYDNIQATYTGNEYILSFTNSAVAEAWINTPSATVLGAQGKVYIDQAGNLKSSIYQVVYQQDAIQSRITAEIDLNTNAMKIVPPEDPSIYTPIDNWEALIMLEKACGYLTQTKQISAVYSDMIFFEAMGDSREKQVSLLACFDNEWSISVETNITTKNESKLDQSQTNKTFELFKNGQYCISNNDDLPLYNNAIDVDAACEYFQNQLLSTIILPQHIRATETVIDENVIRIRLMGTDAFGSYLTENASNLLYNNQDIVNEGDLSFITEDLFCYVDLDRTTGLPLASGINFLGSYTVEGLPYSLRYNADQTYMIQNPDTINGIKKAADQ